MAQLAQKQRQQANGVSAEQSPPAPQATRPNNAAMASSSRTQSTFIRKARCALSLRVLRLATHISACPCAQPLLSEKDRCARDFKTRVQDAVRHAQATPSSVPEDLAKLCEEAGRAFTSLMSKQSPVAPATALRDGAALICQWLGQQANGVFAHLGEPLQQVLELTR